jgi:hypothetical protein
MQNSAALGEHTRALLVRAAWDQVFRTQLLLQLLLLLLQSLLPVLLRATASMVRLDPLLLLLPCSTGVRLSVLLHKAKLLLGP